MIRLRPIFKNVYTNRDHDYLSHTDKLIGIAENDRRGPTVREAINFMSLTMQASIYSEIDNIDALEASTKLYEAFFELENIKAYPEPILRRIRTEMACAYMKYYLLNRDCDKEDYLYNKIGEIVGKTFSNMPEPEDRASTYMYDKFCSLTKEVEEKRKFSDFTDSSQDERKEAIYAIA